jgi:hypothetical protein
MSRKLFDNNRVGEAATCIAGELKTLLDRSNYKSSIEKALSENCPAYYANGLTNGETVMAMLRALSMVQIEKSVELSGLLDGKDGDDEDEEAA